MYIGFNNILDFEFKVKSTHSLSMSKMAAKKFLFWVYTDLLGIKHKLLVYTRLGIGLID